MRLFQSATTITFMDFSLKKEILISSDLNKKTIALVDLEEITFLKRIFVAAFYFLFFCLIAGVSVIVPLLHFILPPLFLAIGLYISIKKFRVKTLIVRGAGLCPECSQEILIWKRPYLSKFNDVCENCRRELTITFNK
jgi:hypothetical protein